MEGEYRGGKFHWDTFIGKKLCRQEFSVTHEGKEAERVGGHVGSNAFLAIPIYLHVGWNVFLAVSIHLHGGGNAFLAISIHIHVVTCE